MNHYKFTALVIIFLFGFQTKAQTCTFKISDRVENFGEEIDNFFMIKFDINGTNVLTTDTTTTKININKAGFDTIHYSYINHKDENVTETALCKFRNGETYTVSPCTCCGIFLITPEKNGKRGFVKFKNESKNEYIGTASEIRADTLFKKSETEYVFSSISMNCGFRPNRILIAEFDYYNKKYGYENWQTQSVERKIELEQEQEGYVAYSFNYLFLHEEKIIVTICKKKSEFQLQIEVD